jgi:hypothetical protein
MIRKFNDFLDRHILPWPVRFLTDRAVILVTMGLLIPLIVFAGNTTVVLGINSYLNVMSVAVSSIVLLYAMLAETHQKQIAELQEERAQEDHTHVTTIHTLVLETLANQQQEIEDLKQMIAALQGQAYERKPRQPVADLREMHPRGDARYQSDDATRRMRHLRRMPMSQIK